MKLSTVFGLACAAILVTIASAHAATLAQYPFTGSSLSSTDANAFSTASDVLLDSGLTDATRFTANGNPGAALRINGDETATTFPLSNVANDDFTFEVTPASGLKLTLDTLSFDTAVSAAAVDASVRIQLSTNGTTFTTLTTFNDITSTAFANETADLSPANTALATGLPIYIRFLIIDTATAASAYTAFDNVTVTGSLSVAAVPEPGTFAELALGGVMAVGGMVLRRRGTTV